MLDRCLLVLAIALLAIGWVALADYVSDETALGLRNLVFIVAGVVIALCGFAALREEWRLRDFPE